MGDLFGINDIMLRWAPIGLQSERWPCFGLCRACFQGRCPCECAEILRQAATALTAPRRSGERDVKDDTFPCSQLPQEPLIVRSGSAVLGSEVLDISTGTRPHCMSVLVLT